MKTIGLIGGIDASATIQYYRLPSQGVLRDMYSRVQPRCVIWSCDYNEVRRLHQARDHDALAGLLADAAIRLEVAGADMLMICSTTHHDAAESVQRAVSIPLLHVAEPIAVRLKAEGMERVGLLDPASAGPDVYEGPLSDRHGIAVLAPTTAERESMDWANHLEFAVQSDAGASRTAYRAIMARMVADGAQAILFERTAFMPDLWQSDCLVPLLDTIALHVDAALTMALEP